MGCDDYDYVERKKTSELYPSGDELVDTLMNTLERSFTYRGEAASAARAIRDYVDARLVPIEARLDRLEAFNRPIGGTYG